MMEKKKLLMEFGLRALMEQLPPNVEMGEPLYHYPKGVIDTGKMGQKVFFHPDTIPVMDPDTGIESTKEIVRSFPVPQVRDDYADPTALRKLHPHVKMNEQELDYPDTPAGMDPRAGKPAPPSYTGYSSSKDVMPGKKLVGTGAIGPGGRQLTPQEIKYPNATGHRFSGIPIPKLRDFFGKRRTR
jgi:hypothetical protein